VQRCQSTVVIVANLCGPMMNRLRTGKSTRSHCDRTTSEMRGLSPKIISEDSR
jgi:hypothetical protein